MVPVGPGQIHVLHWEGFEPTWAEWFPDSNRIWLSAVVSGKSESLYVTDVNGSTAKLVTPVDFISFTAATDGTAAIVHQNGAWAVVSVNGNGVKTIPGLQPQETPIGFTSDDKHVFTQLSNPAGLVIYKIDLDSGNRETWQELKPKDQVGVRAMSAPVGITPDGRWIAFTYSTQSGQLYGSDTLK